MNIIFSGETPVMKPMLMKLAQQKTMLREEKHI